MNEAFKRISLAVAGALAMVIAAAEDTRAAGYAQANLVSDGGAGGGANIKAKFTDPQLQNPWGMSYLPGGPFWVSDNTTNETTIYGGNGTPFTPPMNGYPGGFAIPGGGPTGQVSNTQNSAGFGIFRVPNAPGTAGTAPALFIFDSFAGLITAWQPGDKGSAVKVVDNSATHAIYTGLAMGSTTSGTYLYAAEIHHGKVEMYDSTFKLVKRFTDDTLPSGYTPFNVTNVDGQLYVTFAKQDAQKTFVDFGDGLGYVDVFDTDGRMVQRFVSRGALNAPWGVARAPLGFGEASGNILIANFGNGWINRFEPNGRFIAAMNRPDGAPIAISGLWAIMFANSGWGGALAADPTTLYFTAGPSIGKAGVLGTLRPAL